MSPQLRSPRLLGLVLAAGLLTSSALAQSTQRGKEMRYGPALMTSVLYEPAAGEPPTPNGPPYATPLELSRLAALKGLVIRLGEVSVCYDLDTLQLVAAWRGFLDLKKTNIGNYKGYASGAAEIAGPLLEKVTGEMPAHAAGPAKFLGFYRTTAGIALSFELGGNAFLETPKVDESGMVVRDIRPSPAPPADFPKNEWAEIEVKGKLGAEPDATYAVDTIPLPEDNPWKSWIRPTGLDFFPDGRIAICTLNGEVWIGSGLDAELKKVTWKRLAIGLFEPLGLKVIDGKVLVRGRDQITRLHDLNGDGEADFYERFNADNKLWLSYHAFVFDLQADSKGNIYYVTGGNALGRERPWYSRLIRVSADGTHSEDVATGFRAPNGLSIAPDDTIYVSDNQGQWIPASKLNRIKPGGFYGHVADPRLDPKAPAPPGFDPPLCWIPMTMDNSSGGAAFPPKQGWGPLSGSILHTSFGMASMLAIFNDGAQGATIKLPWKLDSGVLRARFSPGDQNLYVVGMKGWQTRAVKEGCLHRIRYTGKPWRLPSGWKVGKGTIAIQFAEPLDKATAEDTGNYAGEEWNYLWHSVYGSPDVSVADPKQKHRDPLEITGAKLSEDGKTLTLEVPQLTAAMQVSIKINGQFKDGAPLATELAGTVIVNF
jgi:hypothetical protein